MPSSRRCRSRSCRARRPPRIRLGRTPASAGGRPTRRCRDCGLADVEEHAASRRAVPIGGPAGHVDIGGQRLNPAPGVRDQHRVVAVREEMRPRDGGVRRRDAPLRRHIERHVWLGRWFRGRCRRQERHVIRDSLLEDEASGPHHRLGQQPAAEDAAEQAIGDRQESHALVMGHVGADDRRTSRERPDRREVDRTRRSHSGPSPPSLRRRSRFAIAPCGSTSTAITVA